MLPGQVTESALHAVAGHGVADGLADHEAHTHRSRSGGSLGSAGSGTGCEEVDDEGARPRPPATAHRRPEGGGVAKPVGGGQHGAGRPAAAGLRPPGSCGPCGGARTRSHGRRGCACAGGNRAPCDGGGCSAGTYACSRGDLRNCAMCRSGVVPGVSAGTAHPRGPSWSPRQTARGPACCGIEWCVDMRHRSTPVRPPNGTRCPSGGSNRAPCGQPLDPQVARLLAFARPEIPHGRRPHVSRTGPAARRSSPRSASDLGISGFRRWSRRPTPDRLTTPPGSMHNLWTNVWTPSSRRDRGRPRATACPDRSTRTCLT